MRYACAAALLVLGGCSPRAENAPADQPGTLEARRAIWAAIQPLAAARGLDPGFVYAIVKVESGFDPHAMRGDARGLMQIKPRAWRAASGLPYGTAVWDWRSNLGVGIDSLGSLKEALVRKGAFTYPLLWASYHYGFDYVKARGFDMSRIPRPSDPVSYRLFTGEVRPVHPPQ
ncbi:MAG TPA: transglycosylase SLT domain-containing protein [Opitutaceae bacterium]